MIKIYGNTYYMTSGEACYIARNDGELMHVCCGKRIEPEDDASLLGGAAKAVKELDDCDIEVCRAGKRVTPKFTVRSAYIEDKRDIRILPTLRGEETLKVSAFDGELGLELDLYYTPYHRGGISRRAELKNVSDKAITVKRLMSGSAATGSGELKELSGGGYAVVTPSGAYGIYTFYAGATDTVFDGNRIASGAKFDGIKLEAGEKLSTPETLIAYSDCGVGGVVRIFHDIIREYGIPEQRLTNRSPIVVYCPTDGDKRLAKKRVEAASEMGADTVAIDVSCGEKTAEVYASEVRASGMELGLKASSDGAETLLKLVKALGAEYVELDFGELKSYDEAVKAHELYAKLRGEHPEIEIDVCGEKAVGTPSERLRRLAYSPIPLCAVRNVVENDGQPLKTAFDVASFGGLGYKLDPAEISEGARRAIRAQILSYQDDAETVKLGDVYDIGGGIMVVGKDKSKAYAATAGEARFVGLDVHNLYHVRESGKTFSGAALSFYGLANAVDDTVTYHIRQVADYE